MCVLPTLLKHQVYSNCRINELIVATNSLAELQKNMDYCVFATGAFARHEANAGSGIDLFLLTPEHEVSTKLPNVYENLLTTGLAQSLRDINLAGEVVATYSAANLVQNIGTTQVEQQGYWGTRMLFLLESIPIHNPKAYEKIGKNIAMTYEADFHRHTRELPAVFLIYDIIKYWKTTYLAYGRIIDYKLLADEHHYYLHLRNLKLVYSKKLTCYSFILLLLMQPHVMHAEGILKIICMKPLERLLYLADERPDVKTLVQETIELFAWFLDLYDQSEDALRHYMNDPGKRNNAFDKGIIVFGQKILDLTLAVTQNTPELLKYLLI